jgi:hypothetical protein
MSAMSTFLTNLTSDDVSGLLERAAHSGRPFLFGQRRSDRPPVGDKNKNIEKLAFLHSFQ